MATARERATGWINVTSYDSQPYDQAGGLSIAEVHVIEDFAGDFRGAGTVRLIMLTRPEGSATFVGLERFVGSVGERSGSFVFRNCGTLEDGEVVAEWLVIPGSGTGQLTGMRGEGGCRTASGVFLDYWFE